jgi:hypothetical protein
MVRITGSANNLKVLNQSELSQDPDTICQALRVSISQNFFHNQHFLSWQDCGRLTLS